MIADTSNSYDYTDVFDTISDIHHRFAASKDVDDSSLGVDSERVTSSSLFIDRVDVREEFVDCVDKCDSNVAQVPKSLRTFIDAIRKNRCLQTSINSKMVEMEVRVKQLNKLMGRVKELRLGRRAFFIQRDARVQLISVPNKRGNVNRDENDVPALYKGPLENPHVSCYNGALAKFPVSVRREKWSDEERKIMSNEFKQQLRRVLYEQAVDELGDPNSSYATSNNFDTIIASIRNLDITPEHIRLFLPKVNWKQLASMYLPGRSDAECQSRFLNFEEALVNHSDWTAAEEKKLLHVLQQRGHHNWIEVAALLGTDRTPFQCLARYQRSLNASILKSEWTTEEDNQLKTAVESYGESDWQLIASVMDGRTGEQCSNRWLKTLHPYRKRVGKWSREEDKQLKVAVTLFGPKTWKKIAQYVPGRTEVQCRERWINCLDPSLNTEKWSVEEDCKLKSAISEHGYCWSKVAASIHGRTDNQCLRRWKVLFPHEVSLRQAARKVQKSALISNFVSRESERPALGPNDFVQPEIIHNTETNNIVRSGRENRKSSSRRTKEDAHPEENCAVKKKTGVIDSERRCSLRTKRPATECEDPDSSEECGLPFMDPTFKRVIVSEERHELGESDNTQNTISKLHPRQKGDTPGVEVTETIYEKERRAWRNGESDWQLITSVMDGRTGEQCSNRWLKTLHPYRKRVGIWSREEDKQLKVAVTLFGQKTWKKIAQYVPGRTEVQCRERWINCLDPSLNTEKWCVEEDCKLKSAISEHGYCWSKVAASIHGRTDNQCLRRWKVLFPHEVCLRQAARKVQKSALISNFVSRESERPALGPNDFVQPEIIYNTETNNIVHSGREKRKSSSRRTKEDAHPEENCAVKKKTGAIDSERRRSLRKKRPATECEDPDSSEECGLPFRDPTFKRVSVSANCIQGRKGINQMLR